jgi:ABC-type oligopeptide transport system substrate-binding subunit
MLNDPVYDAFWRDANASTSLDEVRKDLADCNEYLLQNHVQIQLLQVMTFSLIQPWLHGYNGQNNALTGPYGPSLLFFYPARFWIDKGIK